MPAISEISSRPLRYSAASKWLHWLVAIAVIALVPSGLTMKRLLEEGPTRDQLYSLHEAFGALVLIAMLARLAARLIFGAPPPAATLSQFERRASVAAHHLLYLLLFIVPILGWVGTNAYGEAVDVFGLFSFPTLMGKDTAFSERIFTLHLIGGLCVTAIMVPHISAALHHRFVKRDEVLGRMLPQA